jgi:hypothetical protein
VQINRKIIAKNPYRNQTINKIMKKIIAISLLTAAVATTSAFGQGYLTIASASGQVFSGLGSTAVAGDTSLNWALYWAPNSTANPMPGAASTSSTSGNNTTTVGQAGYSASQAWSALNGSAFTLAVDATDNTGNPVIDNVQPTGIAIYWTLDSFAPGASFGIQGTGASSYSFMEVAWSAAYSSPSAAAAANGAIGWSYVSSYGPLPTDPSATAAANGPAFGAYGVFAPVTAVPEPGTMALAAIGGISMLMFRRRK